MILSCAITVLKSHSLGAVFAPVAVNNHYQLQNNNGEILIGIRGAVYQFKTENNARVWLCSNLSRLKNSDAVSENHLNRLYRVYSETNAEYLLREIESINEFDSGGWQVTECNNEVVQIVNYPIGHVLIDTANINPFTFLGYGEWQKFGAGRVLVGLDENDADFNALGKTGGAKTHQLSVNEMPTHTHIQDAHTHLQEAHNHGQQPHSHLQTNSSATAGGSATTARTSTGSVTPANATYNTNNTTANNLPATANNQNTTAINQNTGGNAAHNNLQPYITVIFWVRAA